MRVPVLAWDNRIVADNDAAIGTVQKEAGESVQKNAPGTCVVGRCLLDSLVSEMDQRNKDSSVVAARRREGSMRELVAVAVP